MISCPLNGDGKWPEVHQLQRLSAQPPGTITFQTALAQSCNTAFIGQRGKLKGSALADAAGSLGVGIDYDVGFPSFFGSVPDDPTPTGRAAAIIGQGKIEASPMAMAGVVASVAAGETVIPHLIDGTQATSKAKPLTGEEARQLRGMMRAVVTEGSGHVLGNLPGPRGAGQDRYRRVWRLEAAQDPCLDDRGARRSRGCGFRQRWQVRLGHGWPPAADLPGESAR